MAITVIGIVAVIQIGLIIYAFFKLTETDKKTVSEGARVAESTEVTPAEPVDVAALERALVEAALPKTPQESVEPLATPAPRTLETPSRDPEAVLPPVEIRISKLIEQARGMREKGDMQAALVKLREAQTFAMDNPLVVSEIAMTYEMMGLTNKSAEYWRRVLELGDAAGALRQLAEMKLQPMLANPSQAFTEMVPGAGRDEEGLQPGSLLGLIEVEAREVEDPSVEQKVTLRVGIKARAGQAINLEDVIVQVFFYDLLDGENIVLTNADVKSEWTTAPADWKDGGVEVLEISYIQPKKEEKSTENAQDDDFSFEETRSYLGYIVRLYYVDQLEDVRADPVRLLTLFPPALQVEE